MIKKARGFNAASLNPGIAKHLSKTTQSSPTHVVMCEPLKIEVYMYDRHERFRLLHPLDLEIWRFRIVDKSTKRF